VPFLFYNKPLAPKKNPGSYSLYIYSFSYQYFNSKIGGVELLPVCRVIKGPTSGTGISFVQIYRDRRWYGQHHRNSSIICIVGQQTWPKQGKVLGSVSDPDPHRSAFNWSPGSGSVPEPRRSKKSKRKKKTQLKGG
jgi:hypothetical protein